MPTANEIRQSKSTDLVKSNSTETAIMANIKDDCNYKGANDTDLFEEGFSEATLEEENTTLTSCSAATLATCGSFVKSFVFKSNPANYAATNPLRAMCCKTCLSRAIEEKERLFELKTRVGGQAWGQAGRNRNRLFERHGRQYVSVMLKTYNQCSYHHANSTDLLGVTTQHSFRAVLVGDSTITDCNQVETRSTCERKASLVWSGTNSPMVIEGTRSNSPKVIEGTRSVRTVCCMTCKLRDDMGI
jgi:hypothetical protein